jgi:anthranilate 1,2-dioxygenase small subunit
MATMLVAIAPSSVVADLLEDYVACLDEDRLEEWPELFLEDGLYKIVSRENEELWLPAPLQYLYSKAMMQDRVTAIRDALTFEPVYTRHITSNLRVWSRAQGKFEARSNFTIYQTTEEGRTRLYAVGQYRDVISPTSAGLRFSERVVLLDSFAVLNLIAAPL